MKTPEPGESWGILGGTFDPIHVGHIHLASDILKIKNLDGIVMIPSFSHPFKHEQTIVSFDDRLAMTTLAANSYKSFFVSAIERDKNLSGYTLDTIKAIKKKYPKVKFCFIIGADNISQLPLWHNASQIFKEIQVVAGKRPHFDMEIIQNDFSQLVEYIESSEIDISSTEIKSLLQSNDEKKLKTILDSNVLQYIKERNLYLK